MSNNHRKPNLALLALTAAFAAAPAFAQSASSAAPPAQDASQATTTSSTAATQQPPTTGNAQTQTSGDASAAPKKGWEEVDADKDGAISKSEAAASDGLTQVFDKADTDADGKLTTDEYKHFVNKNYGEKPKAKP